MLNESVSIKDSEKTKISLEVPIKANNPLKNNEKYKIEKLLARGGMASVFVAKDSNCRRKVALKIMQNADEQSDELINRFIEEAQIAAQLDHPNILPVYDLTSDGQGNPFYAMKLVKGDTLEGVLEKLRNQDPETLNLYPISKLLQIFVKICDAISFSSSRKVVHRDLKPENIMIGPYGEVYVMDWGIAKVIDTHNEASLSSEQIDEVIDRIRQDDSFSFNTTIQGQILGTPGFMAPEQVYDSSSVDISADIYALGGILYSIIALVHPHSEIELKPLIKNKIAGKIPSPEKRAKDANIKLHHFPKKEITGSLSAVCQKAMALNPIERYDSVLSLQKEILDYLDGYATQAESASQWRLLQLLFKRHQRLGFSISLLIFVTACYLFVSQTKLEIAQDENENANSYATQSELQARHSSRRLYHAKESLKLIKGLLPEIEMQVESLIAQSRNERALEVIRKFQKITDSETLNFYRVQILLDQNKNKKALSILERALKKYPNSNKLQTLKIRMGL
ncbi:MAG: serine/threonine protein kinase [Lentisphaeraceae bacterium]|nr:serine/threonine protein kinase [Lentisphaeraceae bacterium]